MDEWIDGWMDREIYGWMAGWMNGWMDEWADRQIRLYAPANMPLWHKDNFKMKETDKRQKQEEVSARPLSA